MIPVKLLKIKGVEPIMVDNLVEFIQGLNNVLKHNIEIVETIDPSFDGYYLLPMGYTKLEHGDGIVKKSINEKVFLLSVINSNIPRILEECKPAGLTNWVLFKDAGTSIISNVNALNFNKLMTAEIKERNLEYDYYSPISKDGTYETVAKSILKYLELYDKYLKSK